LNRGKPELEKPIFLQKMIFHQNYGFYLSGKLKKIVKTRENERANVLSKKLSHIYGDSTHTLRTSALISFAIFSRESAKLALLINSTKTDNYFGRKTRKHHFCQKFCFFFHQNNGFYRSEKSKNCEKTENRKKPENRKTSFFLPKFCFSAKLRFLFIQKIKKL